MSDTLEGSVDETLRRALRTSNTDPSTPACPDWCQLARHHGWDGEETDGRRYRGHQGPYFGDHVTVCSIEHEDTPGAHKYEVSIGTVDDVTDAQGARDLAEQIEHAADWVGLQAGRWWKSHPNPACPTWCEREHAADDFSFGAGFLCVRKVAENEFFVVQAQQNQFGVEDSPGKIDIEDPEIYFMFSTKWDGEGLDPETASQVCIELTAAVATAAGVLKSTEAVR